MRFAKWVFLSAGVFGVLAVAPQYFLEQKFIHDYPPPLAHPEFYYAFIGVALAWQILFFLIGADPIRFRPAMLVGVLEKLSFAIALAVLHATRHPPKLMVGFSIVDWVWAVLFVIAYLRTSAYRAVTHSTVAQGEMR